MIKNIIFDVGGIILDDSYANIAKVFSKDMQEIYRKVYSGNFKRCLLGEYRVIDYIKEFKSDKDYKDIREILAFENQSLMNPLMKENYDYICKLKARGYHLYILSNLTRETYKYLSSLIDINKYFDGAIFSFEVGLKKPDKKIFDLIINRYALNLDETIFFDDKEKNVKKALELGLKAKVFKTIADVEDSL